MTYLFSKLLEAVIYSIGSLYTSIIPCLILRGVGVPSLLKAGLDFSVTIASNIDKSIVYLKNSEFSKVASALKQWKVELFGMRP